MKTKTIEKIMQEDGWIIKERENCGRIYTEFHKNGLIIDLEGIEKNENNK